MGEDAKISRAVKTLLAAQACLVDVEWILRTVKGYNKARAASIAIHKCLDELYTRAPIIDLQPVLPKPRKRKKTVANEPMDAEP